MNNLPNVPVTVDTLKLFQEVSHFIHINRMPLTSEVAANVYEVLSSPEYLPNRVIPLKDLKGKKVLTRSGLVLKVTGVFSSKILSDYGPVVDQDWVTYIQYEGSKLIHMYTDTYTACTEDTPTIVAVIPEATTSGDVGELTDFT